MAMMNRMMPLAMRGMRQMPGVPPPDPFQAPPMLPQQPPPGPMNAGGGNGAILPQIIAMLRSQQSSMGGAPDAGGDAGGMANSPAMGQMRK